jgi:hypothetical protein
MRTKVGSIVLIGVLMTSVFPSVIGMSENKKPNGAVSEEGDYNLVVKAEADRNMFPRFYAEGVRAAFLVWVRNEGPDDSVQCNVTCSITRLFVVGQDPEVVQNLEWIEDPQTPRSGHGTTITFGCPIPHKLFAVYRIDASTDVHDNNVNDNTASFVFFVIWGIIF